MAVYFIRLNLHRLILREQCGIHLPAYNSLYDNAEDATGIKRCVEFAKNSGEWKQRLNGSKEIFDLVLLRVRGYPWHIGTYAGEDKMVNSNKHVSSCVESLTGLKWANNVLGYWYYG